LVSVGPTGVSLLYEQSRTISAWAFLSSPMASLIASVKALRVIISPLEGNPHMFTDGELELVEPWDIVFHGALYVCTPWRFLGTSAGIAV